MTWKKRILRGATAGAALPSTRRPIIVPWLNEKGELVDKYRKTASLRSKSLKIVKFCERSNVGKNLVQLEGKLESFKKFSEGVGSLKIRVMSNYNKVTHDNNFFLTVFKDFIHKFEDMPQGVELAVEGRLKNSSYEREGKTVSKMEIILTDFRVLNFPDAPVPMEDDDSIPF
jgi:hypothetical protein